MKREIRVGEKNQITLGFSWAIQLVSNRSNPLQSPIKIFMPSVQFPHILTATRNHYLIINRKFLQSTIWVCSKFVGIIVNCDRPSDFINICNRQMQLVDSTISFTSSLTLSDMWISLITSVSAPTAVSSIILTVLEGSLTSSITLETPLHN